MANRDIKVGYHRKEDTKGFTVDPMLSADVTRLPSYGPRTPDMPALVTSSVLVGGAKFEASGSNGPPVGRSGPLPTRDLKPIVIMQGFNGSRGVQKRENSL